MKWKTSSFSNGGGSCVKVRQDLNAIKDSKHKAGPNLKVPVDKLIRWLKL